MTARPTCYQCKHRGNLAGSAHSECLHPKVAPERENPLGFVLAVGPAGPMVAIGALARAPFRVLFLEHGLRRGWCNWPWNFDPTWLTSCDGFEQKEQR